MRTLVSNLIATALTLGALPAAGAVVSIDAVGSPAAGLNAFNVRLNAGTGDVIATFQEISITGDVHQVWGAGGNPQTPTIDDLAGGVWNPANNPLDSHILISGSQQVAGGAGGGFGAFAETNDGSNPAGLSLASTTIGVGGIDMPAATVDAFFLNPADQIQVIDLAYVVIPDGGQAFLSIESVLGTGAPTTLTLVPIVATGIAGDYDNDGLVAQGDLDLVLLNWGRDTVATGVPDGWVNGLPSGLVDQGELDGVLLNWGNTAEPTGAAVPEPASSLALLGGLAMAAFRRHPEARCPIP